ncbi:MAG: DUF485 domain-containing protein [Bacteroidota bacterium]
MNHGPAVELDEDFAIKKKTKLGVILFFIYLVVYALFVAIIVIDSTLMGKIVLGNQNLAVVYGFGLIIFAILLGVYYNWQCTKYEDLMNTKEEKL